MLIKYFRLMGSLLACVVCFSACTFLTMAPDVGTDMRMYKSSLVTFHQVGEFEDGVVYSRIRGHGITPLHNPRGILVKDNKVVKWLSDEEFDRYSLMEIEARRQAVEKKRVEEEKKREAVLAQERARQMAIEQRKIEWKEYSVKPRHIIEQAFNYASTANPDGYEFSYWVAVDNSKCIVEHKRLLDFDAKDGERQVDVRDFNMTAFMVSRQGEMLFFGDDNKRIEGSSRIDHDRLFKAFGLVFQECPGKKSAF